MIRNNYAKQPDQAKGYRAVHIFQKVQSNHESVRVSLCAGLCVCVCVSRCLWQSNVELLGMKAT